MRMRSTTWAWVRPRVDSPLMWSTRSPACKRPQRCAGPFLSSPRTARGASPDESWPPLNVRPKPMESRTSSTQNRPEVWSGYGRCSTKVGLGSRLSVTSMSAESSTLTAALGRRRNVAPVLRTSAATSAAALAARGRASRRARSCRALGPDCRGRSRPPLLPLGSVAPLARGSMTRSPPAGRKAASDAFGAPGRAHLAARPGLDAAGAGRSRAWRPDSRADLPGRRRGGLAAGASASSGPRSASGAASVSPGACAGLLLPPRRGC